jgi:hypothetical protein
MGVVHKAEDVNRPDGHDRMGRAPNDCSKNPLELVSVSC